eukprot:CAMPEP_0178992948 /NCGR_PEP_ID=MMETSP0795-20121207/6413_1 /TAXON_ID=88552 /ORGANISM="Amoebophrya sp., Strain Ameob2" /LENGTH=699 /DNA_ID=CAMNT_0020684917 /DNA_START=39 /DNA_END=2138 /DNA_ORIENTATION=+
MQNAALLAILLAGEGADARFLHSILRRNPRRGVTVTVKRAPAAQRVSASSSALRKSAARKAGPRLPSPPLLAGTSANAEQDQSAEAAEQSAVTTTSLNSQRSPDPCKDVDADGHSSCCLRTKNPLSPTQTTYSVKLHNFQNVQYYGDIGIGEAKDNGVSYFPAIYDTGSFEVLVLSEECQQCHSEGYSEESTPLYDAENSKTFSLFSSPTENNEAKNAMETCMKEKTSDEVCEYRRVTAQHMFGSGPVESVRGYESVKIGDDGEAPNLSFFPIWMITAHRIAAWDNGAKFSAIVGLGPRDHVPSMADTSEEPSGKTTTLLERADVNKFSICLSRSASEGRQVLSATSDGGNSQTSTTHHDGESHEESWPPGWLTFNANSDQGETQVEVVGKVHWAVHMPKFGISVQENATEADENEEEEASTSSTTSGSTPAFLQTESQNQRSSPQGSFTNWCDGDKGCAAIIDSGTSLLAAPTVVIEELVNSIGIKEDCSNLEDLPDLEFTFGKDEFQEHFALPPSAYVMKVEQTEDQTGMREWLMGQKKSETVTACVPAFMPLDKEDERLGKVFIMGMSFLRHYRTTYVRSLGSCPPKMYFDKVDKNCNKVAARASESYVDATEGNAGEENAETSAAEDGGAGFGYDAEEELVARSRKKGNALISSNGGAAGKSRGKRAQMEAPLTIDITKIRVPKWAAEKGNKLEV